jgi:MFS transporter, DHA1 family, multidrug resistance protein B
MHGQYFAAASLRYTIKRTIAPIAIPMSLWFGYQITFAVLGALAIFSGVPLMLCFRMLNVRRLNV